MLTKLFGKILVIALIGMVALAGCSSLSDSLAIVSTPSTSEINIPSTSYPVDIEATVIVAHYEIKIGKIIDPAVSQEQLWIVHISIRNKSEPTMGGGNDWQILPKNNTDTTPSNLPPYLTFLYASDWTDFFVPQGQTGSFTGDFFVPAGLDPNDYEIRYIGSTPPSFANLTYDEQEVNYYNWDTQNVLSSYTSPTQPTPTIVQTSVHTSVTAWSHTGYVSSTMQGYGGGYSSITFQDGFALTFVGTVGGYSAPAIGDKVKVTYYYDSSLGGNVITSCHPVQ
jgi:hypothetical protein